MWVELVCRVNVNRDIASVYVCLYLPGYVCVCACVCQPPVCHGLEIMLRIMMCDIAKL